MTTPDCRRQQILEAAERLLGKYGPAKTTIADIAKEAEVGVGTVYLEFASKDAIIDALSTARHAAVLRAMRAAAAQAVDFRDRLRAVLDARVRTFLLLADGGAHAPDLLHCHHVSVRSAHARFGAAERVLLVEIVRDAIAAGHFAHADPDAVAALLLRAYTSFSPPWVYSQDRAEVLALLPMMHRLVLDGLVVRRAE